MPFDGLALKAITKELNTDFGNARIDKIYQPEHDELILNIRQPKTGSAKLLISANARWARAHISSMPKDNPAVPPTFCMLLRKYLEGGRIIGFEQPGLERILKIHIEALDDFREWRPKILICEFMGRHSNIILINPDNNIIIDAIKRYGSEVSSYREVFPGKEYLAPPSQEKLDPATASYDDFAARILQNPEQTLETSLFNTFSGISPVTAKEICLSTGIKADFPINECGEYELSKVYYYLQELLNNIDENHYYPNIIICGHKTVDFAPYHFADDNCTATAFPSLNLACDHFYTNKLIAARLDSMKNSQSKIIKDLLNKAYKKQFHLESDRTRAKDNHKYKTWGELLTSYAHQYHKGDQKAVLEDFYTGESITIDLDPRYTPMQNAQRYFKIYSKSRNALRYLDELIDNNQQEIDYLESVLVAVGEAECPQELEEINEELQKEGYVKGKVSRKKGQYKSSPRRFISSDNLEILVGRNNRQNDHLTLKQSRRTDLWLHAKDIPGTHVIVKLPDHIKSIHDIPDTTLEEAAILAGYYSKAKESNKVPVDYTFRSNVRKPAGAKPGMVIYESYWTILVNPHSKKLPALLESQQHQ